jgi:flagellar operon protein
MSDPRLNPVSRSGSLAPITAPPRPAASPSTTTQARFADALGRELGFRFSAHATARLESRGVSFDSGQLERLGHGIDAAAAKGSREALVLVDQVAMVVAVRNRTVVTALGQEDQQPAVFTNIDTAVIT